MNKEIFFKLFTNEKSNIKKICDALDNGADINWKNHKYKTPLMLSVRICQGELTQELLKFKPSLNEVDNNGSNALFIAYELDCLNAANILLEAGENPFLLNKSQNNVITLLCALNRPKTLKRILDHQYAENKININFSNINGCSPLALAAINSNSTMLSLLLTKKAKVISENCDSFSNLMSYLRKDTSQKLAASLSKEKYWIENAKILAQHVYQYETSSFNKIIDICRENEEISKFVLALKMKDELEKTLEIHEKRKKLTKI